MADRLGLDAEFPGGNWLDRFRNDEGKIGGSENTLFRILQACPETAGAIAFNTRCGGLEARREGPWGDPGPWTSTMTAAHVIYFQGLGIPASVKRLDTALAVFSDLNRFDPLLEYLNRLVWDGKPRIDTWLIDYASAANHGDRQFHWGQIPDQHDRPRGRAGLPMSTMRCAWKAIRVSARPRSLASWAGSTCRRICRISTAATPSRSPVPIG